MVVSFLSLALFSLFIQRHIVSSQPGTPYTTGLSHLAPAGNAITLQCKNSFGSNVLGASFYRNGQNITNSSCLTAYPTSSSSELRVVLQSQECDGFFSCGLNEILSVSTEFHACPVKNVTETTPVEIEEGSSVLLTCNFFPSPIKHYTTTWFIGIGSNARQIENSTSEHLQSYLLQKPDQPNSYYCKIQIQSSTNSRCSPSDISSIIMVRLKKKYEMPTITEDLNYTMDNNGGGVFSVTSRGTNLTHNWYKDGGLINSTGDGILEISDTSLRVKEVNGSLRIVYVVSNVDYDNTSHSMRQTFGVYNRISSPTPCPITEDTMEIIFIVVISIMGIVIFILFVLCFILCYCCIWKKKGNYEAPSCTAPVTGVANFNCNCEEKMKPDERVNHYAFKLMKLCNTDKEFLKLLKRLLNDAEDELCRDDCRSLYSTMINDIKGIMKQIEPQQQDGRVASDGNKSNYEEYRDILKMLEEIDSKFPI